MQMKKSAKKRIFRPVALLLALLLLFAVPVADRLLPDAAAVGDPVPYLRIGLKYGGDAVADADLHNETGSGFDFGYFDDSRNFVALTGTEVSAISILNDWTMHREPSWQRYAAGSGGDITVGCWHILLDTFATLSDAQALASEYADGFISLTQDNWCVCVGSYTSRADAEAAITERGITGTAMSGSDRCVTVVETNSGRILFEFDESSRRLGIMPRASGGKAAVTSFNNHRYYGGFQFFRASGGNMTVVNFVSMDDYTACVIRAEVGNGWPMEALKAQAVAVRSYAAAYLNHHEKKYGFDMCGTSECQQYIGLASVMENCEAAARETSGIYMTYQGEIIKAFYFSCDGGATESCENVFNEKLDYLRGKSDIYESSVKTGWENWAYTYSAAEITDILNRKGYYCATIVGITPKYTEQGNIYSLTFTDQNGKEITVSRSEAGSVLCSDTYRKYTRSQRFTVSSTGASRSANFQSADFYVNSTGTRLDTSSTVYAMGSDGVKQALNLTGGVSLMTGNGMVQVEAVENPDSDMIRGTEFLISGSGYGHNVGMSQYGAKAMAELGYTYKEILNFYYTGVQIG